MGVAFSPQGDFFATVGADDEVSYKLMPHVVHCAKFRDLYQ